MTRVIALAFILCFLESCREIPNEEIPVVTSNIGVAEDLEGFWLINRSGTAYNKGKIYGSLLKEDISLHLQSWDNVVKEGLDMSSKEVFLIISEKTEFLKAIQKYTPELLEELNGIADGAGVDREDLLCFNLAEEIINYFSNGYESCTNIGVIGDSENLIGYNQDLPLFLHGNNTPVILQEKNRYIFAFPGSIGMSGMTKDLAVTVNSLPMLNMNTGGLPLSFMIRKLLTFKNGLEAKEYLFNTPLAIPQNILIVDHKSIYNLEVSANEITEYFSSPSREIVYHTNHPLINSDYRQEVSKDHLCERFSYLENYFKNLPAEQKISAYSIKEVMSVKSTANIFNDETYIRFIGRFPHDNNESPQLEVNNPKMGDQFTTFSFE